MTQLRDKFAFENCSSQSHWGGLFIDSAINGIIETDGFTFIKCSSDHCGDIFRST